MENLTILRDMVGKSRRPFKKIKTENYWKMKIWVKNVDGILKHMQKCVIHRDDMVWIKLILKLTELSSSSKLSVLEVLKWFSGNILIVFGNYEQLIFHGLPLFHRMTFFQNQGEKNPLQTYLYRISMEVGSSDWYSPKECLWRKGAFGHTDLHNQSCL